MKLAQGRSIERLRADTRNGAIFVALEHCELGVQSCERIVERIDTGFTSSHGGVILAFYRVIARIVNH